MFTKKITESDAFLDMPCSTQVLYFHLNMAADDDGFVNNPKKIQRMVGCSDDDMKVLIMKSFILVFDSGVIVIKHWKMHNYIQSDRYKPTDYIEEKSMLTIKKNKSYTLAEKESLENTDENEDGYSLDTNCVQDVSVGKDRLGKDRLGKVKKDIVEKNSTVYPISEIIAYLNAKAGTTFRSTTKSTKKHIKARIDDGYVIDDFKAVIDDKCNDWLKDKKMKQYIRPSTLFIPTNFENYLNKAKASKAGGKYADIDSVVI